MRQRFCNGMIHVIKKGDNLYQLSRKYRVPLALILRANPYVDVYNLQPGQEICIPMSRPIMPFPGVRPPRPRSDEERMEMEEEMRDEMREEMQDARDDAREDEREEQRRRMSEPDSVVRDMEPDIDREENAMPMEQQEEDDDVYVTNGVMSLGDILKEVGMTTDELLANNHPDEIILAADVKLNISKKV